MLERFNAMELDDDGGALEVDAEVALEAHELGDAEGDFAFEAWNASSSGRLKAELLEAAVCTVVAGARSGSLVRSSGRHGTVRGLPLPG